MYGRINYSRIIRYVHSCLRTGVKDKWYRQGIYHPCSNVVKRTSDISCRMNALQNKNKKTTQLDFHPHLLIQKFTFSRCNIKFTLVLN